MTYEELVKKLKSNFEGMDAGRIKEHLAIQFNVAGEAEGALYMEIRDGKVMIEPYEYYDRDILVFVETDALLAIADGELTIYEAFKEGKFYAEGNLGKAELLDSLSKKAAARKMAGQTAAQETVVESKEEENESKEVEVEKSAEEVDIAVEETSVVEETSTVEEAFVVEKAEAESAEEKKAAGKKVPSRKLKKAAAKKNAKKNTTRK